MIMVDLSIAKNVTVYQRLPEARCETSPWPWPTTKLRLRTVASAATAARTASRGWDGWGGCGLRNVKHLEK